jgi:hypothetical protein
MAAGAIASVLAITPNAVAYAGPRHSCEQASIASSLMPAAPKTGDGYRGALSR